HHGGWYGYYRESGPPIRTRSSDPKIEALTVAAEIDRSLAQFGRSPRTTQSISIEDLRREFLDDHEQIRHSSLNTLSRYRAATQYVVNFTASRRSVKVTEFPAEDFVRYLRQVQVSPNGHPNTSKRPLRGRGLQYILEVTRLLFEYARRRQYLPAHLPNPLSRLRLDQYRVEDRKPVYYFDAKSELAFLKAAGRAEFPIFCMLSKTGLRPGEAIHLLIEDLDLSQGWASIRNRPQLEWRIKTGRERRVPLIPELVGMLQESIAGREAGPVFLRPSRKPQLFPAWDAARMAIEVQNRIRTESQRVSHPLTRVEQARMAEKLWREVGIYKTDTIRLAFMKITKRIGLPEATCPKSWRHTFATLLQDANVDPLIRQIVMGHKSPFDPRGALGMTSVYTHSRPETIRREILRALQLWPQSLQTIQQQAQGGAS
ncbi:MAG: tyrosine-type recombinase/integrase, partial [Planctomycetaceae bacterium]|nr:tyrosine-type recombinase/integrase [Planctomycetaceae bacterium]